MPYSREDDLLLGDIPLGARLDRNKFVQDAADEIDSIIGTVYVTPVPTTANSEPSAGPPEVTTARHSQLLLKRLNNFLATGRLILAIDAGGEDTTLHAYGLRLIEEVLVTLEMIRNGSIVLDGVDPIDEGDGALGGPKIFNYDAASGVDAFYERVMVPESNFPFPPPYRDWAPGDDPNSAVTMWG